MKLSDVHFDRLVRAGNHATSLLGVLSSSACPACEGIRGEHCEDCQIDIAMAEWRAVYAELEALTLAMLRGAPC